MFVCGGSTICWIVCCGVVIVRRKFRNSGGRHFANAPRLKPPPPGPPAKPPPFEPVPPSWAEPPAALFEPVLPVLPEDELFVEDEFASFWTQARILSCS